MTAGSHDAMGRRVTAPPGYSPVASWIISRDTAAELTFLSAVFGATEKPGSRIMNGGKINHVEIDLEGTALMLFDAGSSWPLTPAHTRIYVNDLRTVLGQAEALGARIVTEPRKLPFGDFVARFRDPQGHLWWVHQHVEDVGLDEMNRRFGEDRYVEALAYVGDTLQQEMERR
jgi:PhnB protein